MATIASYIQRSTRALQPAATAVSIGTLYCVTDESNLVERSNGTTWQSFSPSGAGSGTVTNTGTLTDHGVIVGNGGVDVSALATGTSGQVLVSGGAGADPAWATRGKLVQEVNVQTGAVATGTTTIPFDDTIPQNTEGTEFMTLAITPTSATNKLKIEVVFYFSNSASTTNIVALFQDTTADALATVSGFIDLATASLTLTFTHYMTAGTTSATTFKVRAGSGSAGTLTFNGQSGARRFGGTAASSITISEIIP